MGGERVISFDETSIDDLIALTGHTSASSKPTLATDDTFSSHKRTATVSFDDVPLDDLISIAQCQDPVPEIGIAYWLGKQWLFGESNYDLCLRKVRTSGTRTTYRLPEGCSSAAASDAAGKMWSALATDDDGACALHAALGAPAERPSVLRCSRARVLASRLVGPTLQDVRVRAQDERLVTCVASALWSEFVLPSMRQDEEIAEDFESTLFMEHLRLLCPSVTSEVDELQNAQSAARDAESSLRRQLMQATRDLFLCSESGELIHSMSSRMGHIPASWPHSMLLEADGVTTTAHTSLCNYLSLKEAQVLALSVLRKWLFHQTDHSNGMQHCSITEHVSMDFALPSYGLVVKMLSGSSCKWLWESSIRRR